jgi:signal transduction histidine kinase
MIRIDIGFYKDCKRYNISLWECPTFVFILMGFLEIVVMLGTFVVGQKYFGPEVIIPAVFVAAVIIFISGGIIVKNFEKLAETNRLKSEFVSIVSHQLRSPINAIKWSVEFLNKHTGKIDSIEAKYLDLIEQNNTKMLKLVTDLLNVSRLDKGEIQFKNEPVEIDTLIRKVAKSLEPLAASRNVKIKLDLDENLQQVKGDELYLNIVINNFIDNAIKYSKDKGGKVRVRARQEDSRIRVEVEDEGVGIGEKDKKLIFSKFFRGSNAKQEQIDGTGLGLFIGQSIIKNLGGKISFHSKLGEGTTFWFTLPVATSPKARGK